MYLHNAPDGIDKPKSKKRLTPTEALTKIQRYCAYQERSHKEVKTKLFEYGLYANQVDDLISQLITDGFLNEQRFAKAYAGGKFRMKKWGRLKIKNELEFLGLTKNCIRQGLKELDDADYIKTLKSIVVKKAGAVADENIFSKRDKVARYAIGKGYEPELVWGLVKELFPD
ncbi:MAG TPA: regulatory protein RecX [Cyclobacteriaceae bacterium]|jgi:regulatory protein|nr:RecX family transcriptional regulator [Cytophagales bacterium]HMR57680.1 regulatory protein RecX [Cyclobacteriaceae bacterium]HNT49556.1 regulatory protein RecX [Cyclobacteriaceae bacterium]HRE65457.1 regulatory protein RecX [Cyclobacteriaceae bacterium]HRF32625.1 regulatory protein RecX [Cyclobacteriaceae bacterium]